MTSKAANKFSSEVRSRAVRLVFAHKYEHASQWAVAAERNELMLKFRVSGFNFHGQDAR